MERISFTYEPKTTLLRLKLPKRFQTLSDEEINLINTKCIKNQEPIVICTSTRNGVYIVGFETEPKADLDKLQEEMENMWYNITRRYKNDRDKRGKS